MHNILKQLAKRIKELRRTDRLSQEQLAEKADVHPTYIGKIERAELNPSIVFVEKIADAFNLSLSEFFAFPHDEKITDASVNDINALVGFLEDALELAKRYRVDKKNLQD